MITINPFRVYEDKPQSEVRYEADEFLDICTDRIFWALAKSVPIKQANEFSTLQGDDQVKAMNAIFDRVHYLQLPKVIMEGIMVDRKFVVKKAIDDNGFYFIDSFKGLNEKIKK